MDAGGSALSKIARYAINEVAPIVVSFFVDVKTRDIGNAIVVVRGVLDAILKFLDHPTDAPNVRINYIAPIVVELV